ncbi:uncharacterized protein LAESUDRAFT_296031 [Laetiporus sulphureus 93-53]|uniref:WW domain-containing protein n=1 Tax=Laetiporus sulphureus 93-53 TaxID=1314785 RepID=A0A165DB80_9APHY|nr:uncharacterized protein LAESUDRAFT_296031 [Laetiporus sulphureus 93-53]KZT04473.1 hypothetical protein LAESUDRAFT_296031 [Laetiporus sulphureus 93-53]
MALARYLRVLLELLSKLLPFRRWTTVLAGRVIHLLSHASQYFRKTLLRAGKPNKRQDRTKYPDDGLFGKDKTMFQDKDAEQDIYSSNVPGSLLDPRTAHRSTAGPLHTETPANTSTIHANPRGSQISISIQSASSDEASSHVDRFSLSCHGSITGEHGGVVATEVFDEDEDRLRPPSSRPSSRTSSRQVDRLEQVITHSTSPRAQLRAGTRTRLRSAPSRSFKSSGSALSVATYESGKSKAESQVLAVPAGDALSLRSSARIAHPKEAVETYPVLWTERYDRKRILENREFKWETKAMNMTYPLEGKPEGWEALTHPEGQLYFFHPTRLIYTDEYLCDPNVLREIEDFVAVLDRIVEEQNIQLPPGAELVLDLRTDPETEERYWCYYYVNHKDRVLFWIQDYEVTRRLGQLKGIYSATHIKLGIEEYYWLHWDTYPYNHEPSYQLMTELKCIVTHANADLLTSNTTTLTWNTDELYKMLAIVKDLEGLGCNQWTACVVAHHRYLNHHGQKAARLARDQSLFGDVHTSRSPLIALIAPLLFYSPMTHLNALDNLFIDGVISIVPWTQFIGKLQNDWTEQVLTATVLLNANISFMTITDVDDGTNPRTWAQVVSFVSTIASIGSTIVGLLLLRQYRLKPKDTSQDAVNYLTSRKHPTLGLETLAIMYSLPYALLMWGMITFLAAFACECFVQHDARSTIVSAVAWGLVGMLLAWYIYTAWEGGDVSIRVQLGELWTSARLRISKVADVMRISSWHAVFRPSSSHTLTPDIRELHTC